MNKKLTLNVDETLIKFARTYSKQSNQSISNIFEKYLIRLKNESKLSTASEEARELYGILSNGKSAPDKKEMRSKFYEKMLSTQQGNSCAYIAI